MKERFDSRPSCPRCVWKHLSAALVLGGEYLSEDPDGSRPYKDHLLFMNGHLSQAEEQSLRRFPEMSKKIREVRLRIENAKFSGESPSAHVISSEDVEEILFLGGMGMDGLPLESDLPVVETIVSDSEDEETIADEVLDSEELPLPPIAPAEKMDKISQQEAGYVVLGTSNFCQDCNNWMGSTFSTVTGTCSIVRGNIFSRASCPQFEPKKK